MVTQINTTSPYNVECMTCGQVFHPPVKSPLWWKAKKRAEAGFLDAIRVDGKDCGCVEQPVCPETPFRVFGYDSNCIDFDIPCNTFINAVTIFRQSNRGGSTVFITGVSDAVMDRMQFGHP